MDGRRSPFARYARYYDALYADKDYDGEARYVVEAAHRAGRDLPTHFSVLDLGCGTGRHLEALRELGARRCIGIDQSREMLARARSRSQSWVDAHPAPVFLAGDAASVRVSSPRFDLVVSLFHVFSYQTTDSRAHAFLQAIESNLAPGGCAVFDFWYGPAVEMDPPERRARIIGDTHMGFSRTATPLPTDQEHVIDIAYEITPTDGSWDSPLVEVHRMRYWFLDEVRTLCRAAGLSIVGEYQSGAWASASPDDWNCTVCCVRSVASP